MARQGYDLDTIIRKAKTISDVAKVKEADESMKWDERIEKEKKMYKEPDMEKYYGNTHSATEEQFQTKIDRVLFDLWLTGKVPERGMSKNPYVRSRGNG